MAVAAMGLVAEIVGATFAPGPYIDHPAFTNIYAIRGAVGNAMSFMELAAWPVFVVSMVGGVASMVSRMRRGTEKERQQVNGCCSQVPPRCPRQEPNESAQACRCYGNHFEELRDIGRNPLVWSEEVVPDVQPLIGELVTIIDKELEGQCIRR